MTDLQKAAQQALVALAGLKDNTISSVWYAQGEVAITALRQALESEQQRDQLLAACLKIDKAFANAGDWPDTFSELMELHEAINAMRFALPVADTKEGNAA